MGGPSRPVLSDDIEIAIEYHVISVATTVLGFGIASQGTRNGIPAKSLGPSAGSRVRRARPTPTGYGLGAEEPSGPLPCITRYVPDGFFYQGCRCPSVRTIDSR
jgi:hypothetical protein